MGNRVRGRMRRVIKDITQSAVLLEAEISDMGQGVAQGCSMLPILLSNLINQLLDEVKKAVIGINIRKDVQVGGLMFAERFCRFNY